jgi:imidazolonepropionase-like amidohydrolase
MRARSLLILSLLALFPLPGLGQTTPVTGIRENNPTLHALTDVRIVIAPGRVVERGTVVIRNGIIEAAGANVTAPAGARIWSLPGKTVYPGFIEPYASVGTRTSVPSDGDRGPVYWNPQVRAFASAADEFASDDDQTAQLRAQGFTAALTVPRLGMFSGEAAIVSLGSGTPSDRVLRPAGIQGMSLNRDNRAGGGYPTSAMGSITFLRQTLHDADWYDRAQRAYLANPQGLRRPETNRTLAALVPVVRGQTPVIIDTRNEDELLRAASLAAEFNLKYWLRGTGFEYRILDEVKRIGVPVLLPVNPPAAPNVQTAEAALGVSLEQLRHWELAPQNPGRLAAAGVEFAFTTDGLGNRSAFLGNVRRAVESGLAPDQALAALTTIPARLLGVERTHGTVEAGKMANLVVVDGDLFANGARIMDVWVDGERFEITDATIPPDARGRWVVTALDGGAFSGELEITGADATRLAGVFRASGEETRVSSLTLTAASRRLNFVLPATPVGQTGTMRLSATLDGNQIFGFGDLPDGGRVNFRATRAEGTADAQAPGFALNTVGGAPSFAPVNFEDLPPAMEFGRRGMPDQPQHILVRNATVWTQGPQGKIENADLLVTNGRVAQVGQGLSAPSGAVIVDGTGKHVTPGLIDAHLHSGVAGGVNETGSAIVPEVRIGDVLSSNNIWMYRQLAGGLTTAHVMHGSANPIGGQNQTLKLRWGALPEQLKLAGAPRTVKFALGENVVRSQNRYPNTRMGVEQIIADHFRAARAYEREWAAWEQNPRGIPPRRDLRLEALRDILNGDISVQSHSYRQDEILMLIRLAEEFDLQIDAFHHGVEAYRVAPELAAHGAAAVVWSDWSSFKLESYNATTYNVKVLMDAGVVTSLHSDDSEIASRMNWEAAKMLRTGVSEEDALALVTSNTAKVLGIDRWVGSLEPGKDGDFVIWNAHPLSTTTFVEQTWIDGRKYFDRQEDLKVRDEVQRERARLIQSALNGR